MWNDLAPLLLLDSVIGIALLGVIAANMARDRERLPIIPTYRYILAIFFFVFLGPVGLVWWLWRKHLTPYQHDPY